ncbi:GntR family transcriptional regulator [Amycolatopsis sp. K13G38]|uniref:GntR family transcriptional regulator n=1 Tax=Amycolatopsis acididurans TaxID=2724524 RepID=A0ABX1J8N3_9PSEU|nr:GntR family transcriptional regulator [Amycolatopsis acididurans]NKQ56151.1 GntR family transcriptional regulator [Amycolatopsis acididurans]
MAGHDGADRLDLFDAARARGRLSTQRARPHADHAARRMRDLLRAGIVRNGTVGGRLPSEQELMSEYGASRATVRQALGLLRDEGLVTRLHGRGTRVLDLPALMSLREYHGVEDPAVADMLGGPIRSTVLEERMVPAPAELASLLGRTAGEQVLCVDYIASVAERPFAVATDYVRRPQAQAVAEVPFRSDWFVRLADAGLVVADTECLFEAALADAHDADLLGLRPGDPVMVAEQVVRDHAGEIFNVALVRSAGRRMTLHARLRRDPAD